MLLSKLTPGAAKPLTRPEEVLPTGPRSVIDVFVKRKKIEDKGRIKSGYICGEESCISLIIVDLQNT
jgi:hypothetical protein